MWPKKVGGKLRTLEVSDQRNLYDKGTWVASFVVLGFLTGEACVVEGGRWYASCSGGAVLMGYAAGSLGGPSATFLR